MQTETKTRREKTFADLCEWLELAAGCIGVLVLVFFFILKPYTVSGTSMEPGLVGGYRVFVLSVGRSPQEGDVVVIERETGEEKSLIKRVIATEGQTVDIDPQTGEVTVDGYPAYPVGTDDADNLRGDVEFPLTVPDGCVFVLGDNRSVSLDSRYGRVGCPAVNDIVGKAVLIFSPLSEFGVID